MNNDIYIINCQFEKLSAVETLKNATNKEKMLYYYSSRHKVNISYHNIPNDITLNAAWKIGLRDHTGNIMSAAEYASIASSKILPKFQNSRTNVNISVTLQYSSLEKLEKLSSFTYSASTNFQIETAATAFLCGYLIMKITKPIHGCDYYCFSHLQDSNSKKKILLLELIYY
jgi:predicted porin